MKIHIILRKLRTKKGVSQENLSKLTGLHRTYISMLERGVRNPSLTTVEKIAAALEVPSWEILKAVHDAQKIK